MSAKAATLRYFKGFGCIAERCEDTCCGGMQILISEENRRRIVLALGEEGSAELAQKLVALPERPYGFGWALGRDEAGTCRFLAPDRLCTLVTRHTEAVLPDACAVFPGTVNRAEGRVEVVASLACPEAARLCLLGEDAVDKVEAPPTVVWRAKEAVVPPPAPGESSPEQPLREAGLSLLTHRQFPLRTRLMQLAELGSLLEGDGRSLALQRVHSGQWQQGVHQALGQKGLEGEPVVQALWALVTGLQQRGSARYNQLLEAVLPTFQRAALEREPTVGQPGGPPLWGVLWQVHLEKSARADRALGPLLEHPLERYWVNDWYREPYHRAPSLLAHAFRMILRGAALRLLLLGHPAVDQLAAAHDPGDAPGPAPLLPPDHRELLGRALVETVQIFAKHVERDRELMELLDGHLTPASLGTDALGRARMFAAAV